MQTITLIYSHNFSVCPESLSALSFTFQLYCEYMRVCVYWCVCVCSKCVRVYGGVKEQSKALAQSRNWSEKRKWKSWASKAGGKRTYFIRARVHLSFGFSSRWHRSARKGPYVLRLVSQQSPQGCPRNSTNICLVEHRSFSTLEGGMSAVSFLLSGDKVWLNTSRQCLARSSAAWSTCSVLPPSSRRLECIIHEDGMWLPQWLE